MHRTNARRDGRGFAASYIAVLKDGWRTLRAGGSRLIGAVLAFQLILALIAAPIIAWLFREALRASGASAVDFGALQLSAAGIPLTLGLLFVLAAFAFWVMSLQFVTLIVLVRRAHQGLPLSARGVLTDVGRTAKKLLRPSSLPLLLYMFVILPLTGFGFVSVIAQGIAIPSFITGELMKSPLSALALVLLYLVLFIVNVRLALTLPIFALTDATGGAAMRMSWRTTRGRAAFALIAAAVTVLIGAAIITLALVIIALVPTAITDEVAPSASPLTAAFSLGAAQVVGALITAAVTGLIAAMLVVMVDRFSERLPSTVALLPLAPDGRARITPRTATTVVTAASLAAAIGLGITAIGTMHRLANTPESLVIAHRGFEDGGVENTISALEAAAEAGADLVEMDVMQTKDGQFIAMHDANLSRLADVDANVKDLTLDELTAITVHDSEGHSDLIPSFRSYAERALELGMPLLVEIKLGGLDTPDHVELLIEELESIEGADGVNALHSNIYHSLDPASVSQLKSLRPDLTVGYTMAFAGLDVPDTPADFIVVEEYTATDDMQDAATRAGMGFMVWTVNEEPGMRDMLRRNVDGIITDHADVALAARAEMDEETGLADTLVDAINRFVVVF